MYKQLTKLISVSNAFVCAYLFQMRNEPEKRNKLINFMRKNNFFFVHFELRQTGKNDIDRYALRSQLSAVAAKNQRGFYVSAYYFLLYFAINS